MLGFFLSYFRVCFFFLSLNYIIVPLIVPHSIRLHILLHTVTNYAKIKIWNMLRMIQIV